MKIGMFSIGFFETAVANKTPQRHPVRALGHQQKELTRLRPPRLAVAALMAVTLLTANRGFAQDSASELCTEQLVCSEQTSSLEQVQTAYVTAKVTRPTTAYVSQIPAEEIHAVDTVFHEKRKERNPLAYIAPAALVGLGIITLTDNGFFSRQTVKQWRDENLKGFHTSADDYLQYAPAVIALGLKALGVKNEHSWAHTIELLVKVEAITTLLVTGMKYTITEPRPDSGALNAFPSGHTAQAFAAATFLHKEFGRGRPWLSVLSYATATSVGALRIMNNRHWVSDTLMGAALGILVTNLVYALDEKDREKKRKLRISVGQLPSGGPSVGVSIPIGK